jgi:hypothetical protein
VQMARFLPDLCALPGPRTGPNAQHLTLLRLGCVCVGKFWISNAPLAARRGGVGALERDGHEIDMPRIDAPCS